MTLTITGPAPIAELVDQGIDLIREYDRLTESRTEALRRLARVVVQLRAQFWDDETNTPDWRGKTWEYRQTVGAMYERAGVPPDSVAGVQASLRYHVGNLLRDVVPVDELEACGMKPVSPRQRMAAARDEAAAVVAALNPRAARVDTGVVPRLVEAVDGLTTRLFTAVDAFDDLPPDELARLDVVLRQVRDRVDAVRVRAKLAATA